MKELISTNNMLDLERTVNCVQKKKRKKNHSSLYFRQFYKFTDHAFLHAIPKLLNVEDIKISFGPFLTHEQSRRKSLH